MGAAILSGSGGAALVGITDAGNYYTSTNVEGALQEAATFLQVGTGAVLRTKQSKLEDSVHVFDFMTPAQIADVKSGAPALDHTAAIQAAINAASTINFGGSGNVYRITSPLNLSAGNKWLNSTGATIDQTNIVAGNKWALTASGALSGTTSNLTSNGLTQNYSVNVVSASGFAVGDWVLLASDDKYPWYDSVSYQVAAGEFLRIRAITSNTIYFTTPITSYTYTTANAAKLTKVNFCENISIKGLKFKGSATPAKTEYGVVLRYVNGIDITDCEFIGQDIYQLELGACIRANVLNNKFYGVFYDGAIGVIFYACAIVDCTQWVNVGDNIFERTRHACTTIARSFGQGFWGQPMYINVHHNHMFDTESGSGGRSWGFEQHGFGAYISFNNNMVDGCYGGVNIDAGFKVEVLDNVFTNMQNCGIDLGDTAVSLGNIKVSGNHISVETNEDVVDSFGIVLRSGATNATDIMISDNMIIGIDGPNSSAVKIEYVPNSRGIVVMGNVIATGTSGPDADSSYAMIINSAQVHVLNNNIMNYKQGIWQAGNYGLVKGNVLRWDVAPTAGYGIFVNCNNSIIDGNVLCKPYLGIGIPAGATNNIVTNNVNQDAVSMKVSNVGTGTLLVNNN